MKMDIKDRINALIEDVRGLRNESGSAYDPIVISKYGEALGLLDIAHFVDREISEEEHSYLEDELLAALNA
jgi:hypothetical protein